MIDWEIEKTPKADPKKLKFNINKPETGLKKIDFNINVSDNKIDYINDKEVVHPSDDLTDDDCNNTKDDDNQHKWTNKVKKNYTLVDNRLQSISHLEDSNKINDYKTSKNYEGDLCMAYNTNTETSELYHKTFDVLYIGPDDNDIGHLIFKTSMK